MAVTEVSGLMKYKDADGNVYLMLPITTKENVDGMEEIDAHLVDTNNPHGVTAEQIGADPSGAAAQALADSKSYTDDEVAGLRDELGAQADWNQNDSTKSDFINNRPFYETDPEEVVIAEGTIPVSGMLQVPANNVTTLTLGETYTVVFDGTTYSDLTCVSVDGLPAVGSSDFSYTDYPFVFAVQNGTTIGMAGDGSVSHTMKVSGYTTEIVQLDRKYIADHIDAFPGEKVSGKNYTIDGESVTAGVGAEVFNDYEKNIASGGYSHVEGLENTASGRWAAHAEGYSTVASGSYSHSEGQHTTASGSSSHAEGYYARATNEASHAEGYGTEASGYHSHAEGDNAFAKGQRSHAEGYGTEASGDNSHAEGWCTKASGENQHVQGKFNIEDADDKYSHIVGNGSGTSSRSNAHTVDWDGTGWFAEGLQVGGVEQDGEGVGYVPAISSAQAGQVVAVKSVDANGKPTGWEAINVSAGSGGGAAIIDVTELPTENINEDTFYRLLSGRIIHNGTTFDGWTCYVVPTLPETGELVYDGTNVVAYYNQQDGAAYGYVPDLMAEPMGITVGWYPLDALAPMLGLQYGGVVTTTEGVASDTVYLLLEYTLYSYKYGWRTAGSGTSWDDLDDRPFYLNEEGWEITYDPETFTGDTYIDLGEGMRMVLVSDMTPSNADLKKCEGDLVTPNGVQTAPMSSMWDDFEQQGMVTDAYAYFQFGMVVRDTTVATPVGTVPKVGSYFADQGGVMYVSRLAKPWNVKQIDPIFLPEVETIGRPGTGECSEVFNDAKVASGDYSHAEGSGTTASGSASHAEGNRTIASGSCSHAEGRDTIASGESSHAEGSGTKALESNSHAEGWYTIASGVGSHAEGDITVAYGENSHAEGEYTLAYGRVSHAEGSMSGSEIRLYINGDAESAIFSNARPDEFPIETYIVGGYISVGGYCSEIISVNEDEQTLTARAKIDIAVSDELANVYLNGIALGNYSHVEGYGAIASGFGSHAEGEGTLASGPDSHAEGSGTTASGSASHAEGASTYAVGYQSHAEGWDVYAVGENSHAEGSGWSAGGMLVISGDAGSDIYSISDNCGTNVRSLNYVFYGTERRKILDYDDSEQTIKLSSTLSDRTALEMVTVVGVQKGIAYGGSSHLEGSGNIAEGFASHAEGSFTVASGDYSHAEGMNTTASGDYSHAEGYSTYADSEHSHAEGYSTYAYGKGSHAEGYWTKARSEYQHVQGKYNIPDDLGMYAHIVGNGYVPDGSIYPHESNAHTVDWDGNGWFAGTVEGTAIILKSSTEGSSKRFKITVDDSGTITATEYAV